MSFLIIIIILLLLIIISNGIIRLLFNKIFERIKNILNSRPIYNRTIKHNAIKIRNSPSKVIYCSGVMFETYIPMSREESLISLGKYFIKDIALIMIGYLQDTVEFQIAINKESRFSYMTIRIKLTIYEFVFTRGRSEYVTINIYANSKHIHSNHCIQQGLTDNPRKYIKQFIVGGDYEFYNSWSQVVKIYKNENTKI